MVGYIAQCLCFAPSPWPLPPRRNRLYAIALIGVQFKYVRIKFLFDAYVREAIDRNSLVLPIPLLAWTTCCGFCCTFCCGNPPSPQTLVFTFTYLRTVTCYVLFLFWSRPERNDDHNNNKQRSGLALLTGYGFMLNKVREGAAAVG